MSAPIVAISFAVMVARVETPTVAPRASAGKIVGGGWVVSALTAAGTARATASEAALTARRGRRPTWIHMVHPPGDRAPCGARDRSRELTPGLTRRYEALRRGLRLFALHDLARRRPQPTRS